MKLGENVHESKKLGFGRNVAGMGDSEVCELMVEAMKAPSIFLDEVASQKITWNSALPGSTVTSQFGSVIRPLTMKSGAGLNVIATDGMLDGEFQANVFVTQLGVKFLVDPLQFTAQGNSVLVQPAAITKPFSPNAFTAQDLLPSGGANTIAAALTPATYQHGWWLNRAFHFLANGYDIQWTYGPNINLLNEELRQTVYLAPNALADSAGIMDVDMQALVRELNASYAANGALSQFILPDTQRIGMTAADATHPIFSGRPSRDFELVNNIVGGSGATTSLPFSKERRSLCCPYIIKAGVKQNIQFVQKNTDFGSKFQQWLAADQLLGGTLPVAMTEGSNIATGAGTAYNERSLDAVPITVAQTNLAQRAIYKGGVGGIVIEFAGFYMTDGFAQKIIGNEDLQRKLKNACGATYAGAA